MSRVLLRVRLVDGRVPLPTYRLVSNGPGRTVVVAVPVEDAPPSLRADPAAVQEAAEPRRRSPVAGAVAGRPVIRLAAAEAAAWHAQLDQRYAEHAGRYRPEVA